MIKTSEASGWRQARRRSARDAIIAAAWALVREEGLAGLSLRDLWMHRIDAARAARRPAELTASHDGRIVADITAEWARRHGKPFTAELSGPAGGTYASNPADPAAEHISLDAIEFCRTLAGRAHATGLLTTIVPF